MARIDIVYFSTETGQPCAFWLETNNADRAIALHCDNGGGLNAWGSVRRPSDGQLFQGTFPPGSSQVAIPTSFARITLGADGELAGMPDCSARYPA